MDEIRTYNKQSGLWGILLFLLVNTIMIVLIVYIGFSGAHSPGEQLKIKGAEFKIDTSAISRFSVLSNATAKMLLDSTERDTVLSNHQIRLNIRKMRTFIASDSVPDKNLYLNIIAALENLQNRNQMNIQNPTFDLSKSNTAIAQVREELRVCIANKNASK
jgi:hypothetical protein